MRPRLAALLLVLGAIGLFCWRAELFTVSKPGDAPRPLARALLGVRTPFDVSLPMVPIGVARLTPGSLPLLVHYWAPWERHGRAQVLALDSLVRSLPPDRVRVAVVCFDPFPSVARYVGRMRLHVPVMLDLRRDLQAVLPCPSVPYTWLLDTRGRVVASQSGEVDWLSPLTRELLVTADSAVTVDSLVAGRPTQARAVSARGRGNQRASSAWAPNSAAL